MRQDKPQSEDDCLQCGFGEKCSARGTPCLLALQRVRAMQVDYPATNRLTVQKVVAIVVEPQLPIFDSRHDALAAIEAAAAV